MSNYDNWDEDCEKMRVVNRRLLAEFEIWLQSSNLAEKTIKNHLSNVEFYINEYLLYDDLTTAENGSSRISEYLGYWFIKKATWASKATVKGNAASLTKFYTCLLEKGSIGKDDLKELKETIKTEMPEWLEALERYEDLSNEEWAF